jgi:hypothetical protein
MPAPAPYKPGPSAMARQRRRVPSSLVHLLPAGKDLIALNWTPIASLGD